MRTARIGMILLLTIALSPIAGTPAMGLGDEDKPLAHITDLKKDIS